MLLLELLDYFINLVSQSQYKYTVLKQPFASFLTTIFLRLIESFAPFEYRKKTASFTVNCGGEFLGRFCISFRRGYTFWFI